MGKRHTHSKEKEKVRYEKRLVASVAHWLVQVEAVAEELVAQKRYDLIKLEISVPAFSLAEVREHLKQVAYAGEPDSRAPTFSG